MMTASMADSANNDYGHGILNAAAAIEYEVMSILDDNNSIPKKYSILKAYPNPFNPSLNIEITVDVLSHLTVDIFFHIAGSTSAQSSIKLQKINFKKWNGIQIAYLVVYILLFLI